MRACDGKPRPVVAERVVPVPTLRNGIVALVACSFFWYLILNSPVTANFQA